MQTDRPTGLWNRDFLLLWAGKALSGIGGSVYSIALAYMILEVTGSEAYIGFILAVGAIPGFLSPLAGAVIDRVPMKRMLISGDLVRVAILVLVGGLFEAGALTTGMIFTTAIIMSTIGIFYAPTFATLLPRLVPERDISRANALNSMTGNVTQLAGYAVGGAVISAVGLANAIVLNAGALLAMAGCLSFIRFPEVGGYDRAARPRFLQTVQEGFTYLIRRPVLLAVPVLFIFTDASTYAFRVLMPERMNEVGLGVNGYSSFFGSLFAGAFAVDIFMSKFSQAIGLLRRVGFGLLGLTAGLFVVALAPHYWSALIGGFIVGAADSFISIGLVSVVHTTCDGKFMGRTWSTYSLIERIGMMLVTAGVGAATLRWDFSAILLVGAGVLTAVGVATALVGRSIERSETGPSTPAAPF